MNPDDMGAPLSLRGWVMGTADRSQGGAVTWPDKSKWPCGTELIVFGGPVDDAETNKFASNIRVYGLCFGDPPWVKKTPYRRGDESDSAHPRREVSRKAAEGDVS